MKAFSIQLFVSILILCLLALPLASGKCKTRQELVPTEAPTAEPTAAPSEVPTLEPTLLPGQTRSPTTIRPTQSPTTLLPTDSPTLSPTLPAGQTYPPTTICPSAVPSQVPTIRPSRQPTTFLPTVEPTASPSIIPTATPTTEAPSALPTEAPTDQPTTISPSARPTRGPTLLPGTTACPSTKMPTVTPSGRPTVRPSTRPTRTPTKYPTEEPSFIPTEAPSEMPTPPPTEEPTVRPTRRPTAQPTTAVPTRVPTFRPTLLPGTTDSPSTQAPSAIPTRLPTETPTVIPTRRPTRVPSERPTIRPSSSPTTRRPTFPPTDEPSPPPTEAPTEAPTAAPTLQPTPVPSTSMPTAPLNLLLTMELSQNLQLADVESFQTTVVAQNVFREAIAESVTYLTADSVSIQSITTILRKRVLRNSDYTILQSGQVSVRYTISVYIESLGYRDVATALADIQAQLKAAIESGFFDTLLLNYADLAGVLDILNGALSSNLVLVNYSVDEKAQPDEEFFTSWPMYGKVLFPIACIIVFIILVCLCMCCYDSHVHRKYTSAHSEGFMTSSGAAKASPKKAANNAGSLQSQLVNLLLGKDNISDTGSDGFYDVQSDGQALAGATIDANGQPASPGNAVISEKSVEIVLAEDNNGTQMISDSLATTTTKDGVVLTNNPVAGSTPTKPSIKSSNSPAPPQSPSALPKFVPDHPTIQSSHDAMSPLMSRSKPQLPNVPSVAMAADKGKKTQRSSLLGLINFSSPTKQRKEKFKGEKRNSKLSQATATTASTNDLQLVPTNSQSAAVSNSVPEALGSAEPSQTPPVGEHAVPETPLADQPIAEEAPHLEAQSSLGNLSPFNILGAFFGLNHPAEETVVENTEAVANEAANNDGHTEGGQVANHAGSTEQAPAPPSPSNPILHQENGQVAGTALPSSPAAAHVAAHTSAPTSPAPHPPASATANP